MERCHFFINRDDQQKFSTTEGKGIIAKVFDEYLSDGLLDSKGKLVKHFLMKVNVGTQSMLSIR